MYINKLIFLPTLLFSLHLFSMEKPEDHQKGEGISQEATSSLSETGGFTEIDEKPDLPPLKLFLNDRNLLKIMTIIEHLKTSKAKKKNILQEGLLFHGPAGTGKFTLAQILSEKSGWNLLALEAKNLAQGNNLFEEDEAIHEVPAHKELRIISNNLAPVEGDKNSHIKKAIKMLLIMLRKAPTILFLHNIESLVNDTDESTLKLFIDLYKNFRPFFLVFLVASTRNSNLASNQTLLEIAKPIQIDLPDYTLRNRILPYYLYKYPVEDPTDIHASTTLGHKISLHIYYKILTATDNFSGADIEEMILNTACALNKKVPNNNKVSSLFLAKNEYDFSNRPISSIIFAPVFPLAYCFEVVLRPITPREAEEYLLSFCAIKQEELQWKKSINLKDKISKKQQLWYLVVFISEKGISGGIALGTYMYKAAKCVYLIGAGPVGCIQVVGELGIELVKMAGKNIIETPIVRGALEASGEQSKRITTEKIQEWFPPKKNE